MFLLQAPLQKAGMPVFLIGGAEKASELDAKRAIDQGTRLAAAIENAKTGEVFNAPETLKAKVRVVHLSVDTCMQILFVDSLTVFGRVDLLVD